MGEASRAALQERDELHQKLEAADEEISALKWQLEQSKRVKVAIPELALGKIHIKDEKERQQLDESLQTTYKSEIASAHSSFCSNQELDEMFAFNDGVANMSTA